MHEVVLAVDAPQAVPYAGDIVLGCEFRTVEGGVALAEDELLQFVGPWRTAAGERLAAVEPGQLLENEIIVLRVVGRCVEAQVAGGALQADLDGAGLLDADIGIADFEGTGRLVRTL